MFSVNNRQVQSTIITKEYTCILFHRGEFQLPSHCPRYLSTIFRTEESEPVNWPPTVYEVPLGNNMKSSK